jgi:hypothetical protein
VVNSSVSTRIPSQERSNFRPKKVDSLSLDREKFSGARKGYSLCRFLNFGTPALPIGSVRLADGRSVGRWGPRRPAGIGKNFFVGFSGQSQPLGRCFSKGEAAKQIEGLLLSGLPHTQVLFLRRSRVGRSGALLVNRRGRSEASVGRSVQLRPNRWEALRDPCTL